MQKILVILGPTATGKTDLGLKLAKKLDGELIACDSRQVYRGLDIGTGKIPWHLALDSAHLTKGDGFWVIDGIKIHLYDVVDPSQQYTVADYVKDAEKVISEIKLRGKLPIIVGGTGLYLKALLEGLPNLAIPVDEKLREELEKLSLLELQDKLRLISPTKWNKLNNSDKQNPRRLLRSIELIIMNPYKDTKDKRYKIRDEYDVLKIGLTAPREEIYKKVDLRVLDWINQGIVGEVEKLRRDGLSLERLRQLGLEYGVLADYLSGEIREIEGDQGLIRVMQGKIHGYVRRQQTWFKKAGDINWFDITDTNYTAKLEKIVAKWYHCSHDEKN